MPTSMKRFSQVLLAWIVCNIAFSLLTLEQQRAILSRNPQTAGFDSLPIFSLVFMTAVALLLWFMIVKRASSVARWILTLIFGFVSLWTLRSIGSIASVEPVAAVLTVALLVCQIAAIAFLFAPDARAWLGHRNHADDAEAESANVAP